MMGLQSFCCFSSALLLVHATILASQLPPASGGRNLQWLSEEEEGLDENYLLDYVHQRWRRESEVSDDVGPANSSMNSSLECKTLSNQSQLELFDNNTCEFVKDVCDKHELFNYLRFSTCDLKYKVRNHAFLGIVVVIVVVVVVVVVVLFTGNWVHLSPPVVVLSPAHSLHNCKLIRSNY